MKRNKRLFALVLALCIILASGCTAQDESSSQIAGDSSQETTPTDSGQVTRGGSLTYAMTQDLVSLDPHVSTDAGTRSVVFNIYEGLVKPTSTGDLTPAVAQSYTISDDAKTYTFTLRDGITFQDGSPVTVEDIQYSLNRYAEVQGSTSAFSSALESVEITDSKTVAVHLKEADSEFLSRLTVAIIPQSNEDPENDPIGTGPYMVKEYKVGEYLDLEKYTGYWNSEVGFLDSVRFTFAADVNTAFTQLQAGTVDVLNYLTTAQVETLEKSNPGEYTIVKGNMNLVHAMFLNNDYEPFQDVRVRQAMCYAVDRDAINEFLFNGESTIIGSHMIPALKTWYEPSTASTYTYDPEKAKELLAEAGYENGFELTITVPSAYSQHVDTAQIIADELSQIGINVTISKVEWSTWLSDVYHDRNYQATVIGFDGALNPSDWLAKYGTDAENNMMNYSNEEYDALLEKALSTTDMEEKASLYKQMQINLSENAAAVYLEDPADFVALNSKYAGYVFYPTSAYDVSLIYVKAQ